MLQVAKDSDVEEERLSESLVVSFFCLVLRFWNHTFTCEGKHSLSAVESAKMLREELRDDFAKTQRIGPNKFSITVVKTLILLHLFFIPALERLQNHHTDSLHAKSYTAPKV